MVNEETLTLVKEFEGLVLKAYPDPGSKDGKPWTIGYGHIRGVKDGDVITEAQATEFLKEDLSDAESVVRRYVKVPLNENQRGALVSFIDNIGETQFKKSSVLSFINAGKLSSVPGRMALYRNNDGKVMAGLVRRRTAEGALWMKPIDIVDTPVVSVKASPDNPKKPWDWGVIGGVSTFLASTSDDVKRFIGNFSEALGVNPIIILVAIGLGFGAYALYNKWKEK